MDGAWKKIYKPKLKSRHVCSINRILYISSSLYFRHGVHQGSLEEPFRQLADVTRFHLTKTTSSQTYDRSKPRDGPLACSAHHLDSLNRSQRSVKWNTPLPAS